MEIKTDGTTVIEITRINIAKYIPFNCVVLKHVGIWSIVNSMFFMASSIGREKTSQLDIFQKLN